MDPMIKKALDWIEMQQPDSIKRISRVVWARGAWKLPSLHTAYLICLKGYPPWGGNVRETARAISSLSHMGLIFPDAGQWLLSQKKGDAWNDNVYDTAYSLIALADMDIQDPAGYQWLLDNYGPEWEHPGTTALVIMALAKQDTTMQDEYHDLVKERALWLLEKRGLDGGWKNIATSNIVMQSLLMLGLRKELKVSIDWLMKAQSSEGFWGAGEDNIVATSLSLITLALWEHKGNL
ncbi:prenyltransferase/squalene oxidase repeat-containing protein [Methanomethylovorans sp.]|uniref:prenyltransferase/squalene oxidase repeat-containing protein n=1 Tax=Methanomethylovorans sp. TaxID=2758717 RepID=UPI00345E72B2